MIYLFTIAVLCVLILVYDFANGSRNKAELYYKLMMCWFIAISGFAYNVGSDTAAYVEEYNMAVWSSVHSLNDFLEFEDARGPGWLLLEFVCRSVSSNFVFFKLIIAAFGNWAIFRFIKRHSCYPFISVLFYGLTFALHLNFNALRQFMAVGFFLVGYDFLIEKKWIKYFVFVFLAYSFHITALICFLFPLLYKVKLNKTRIVFWGGISLIVAYILLSLDMVSIFGDLIFSNVNLLSDDLVSRGEIYFADNNDSFSWSIFGIIRISFFVIIYMSILFFSLTKEKTQNLDNTLYLVFILFYILNFCVPVVFFRFLFFVQPFFICILPSAVIKFATHFGSIKRIVAISLLLLLSIDPISSLYHKSINTGLPLIVQYSPYYSVFNPKIDPVRSSNFGYYK